MAAVKQRLVTAADSAGKWCMNSDFVVQIPTYGLLYFKLS